MGRIEYKDAPMSIGDIVAMLKEERGLKFKNVDKATHLLQNIGYFRLKGYLQPLVLDKNTGVFKVDSYFEDAYNLYKFDSALRKLVSSELEKIEISLRTQISQEISLAHSAYWFTDKSLFRDGPKHSTVLKNISSELSRSDEEQIVSFRRKYSNEFPPSWITMEVTSFGTLSMLFKWFNGGRTRRNIAEYYGVADAILESWIHNLVYVRNICAHHSRLWNKTLRITAAIPKKPTNAFITVKASNDKIYYTLSVIRYLLQIINPNTSFTERLKNLLASYPSVDIRAMGFPTNWHEEPLWK